MSITFCIITFNRTRWISNSLTSISKYCPLEYKVKLLVIGKPDRDLERLLAENSRIETILSPVNLGCGGGRRLLTKGVTSEYTMMLDDDMYLTDGAIKQSVEVLENDQIGAVGLPSANPEGQLVSVGGRNLLIKNRIISRTTPRLDLQKDWIEVEDLDGGAMMMKTEMLQDFDWDDRYQGAFDDLDKSLQILHSGKWKQAIVPGVRLIHDRSWIGENPDYVRVRLDGLAMRRSYKLFRAKWGLRLDVRSHIYYEYASPLLTLFPWQWPRAAFDQYLREKPAKRSAAS